VPLHALTEAALREHCRLALESLEVWLRRLLHDTLTERYGADYIAATHEDGSYVINSDLRTGLRDRRDREPNRYPRPIDAADLDDEIRIICNPNLYPLFRESLNGAFPVGREQARVSLGLLLPPRNALAHANPISVRQAEQVICYSRDVIDSLKSHYMNKNQEKEYDAPTVVRYTDSFGTTVHENEMRHTGSCILEFDRDPAKSLRVGDTLWMQVDIDDSFAPDDYVVEWMCGIAHSTGTRLVLQLENRHVSQQFQIRCRVISKKDWHRLGHCDDLVAITFKVLPAL
jgi:hypothetical protein